MYIFVPIIMLLTIQDSLVRVGAFSVPPLLTAGGMALVTFVFAAVLMLDAGLRKTMVDTGSYDNVVLIRKGAETEVQSGIDRALRKSPEFGMTKV